MIIKSLFFHFHKGLRKTAVSISRTLGECFTGNKKWDEITYKKLEAALIQADFGVSISLKIIDKIKNDYELGVIKTNADIIEITKQEILKILETNNNLFEINNNGLEVILLVGVNGSGKTTTAGKLAHLLKKEGKKVMLAACDTFRAAATEQLKLWGERTGTYVVSAKHGADPAAVAYDATASALAKEYDYLIIDTAGRQHNHKGLMDELAKIKRTINKLCPNAPQEIWLVIDGSIGGAVLSQTKEFIKVCGVNGLICTKLDGSYKGGMVAAVKNEFKLPVYFVGLGEKAEDLQFFDAKNFVDAVFEDTIVAE